jgi:hypothetical protein
MQTNDREERRMARKLLSTKEAAAELGIIPRRLRTLKDQGRLKGEKIGRDLFFSPKELDKVRERPTGRPPKAKASTAGKGK